MEHEIYELARETGYPAEAFFFVQRGLEFTVNQIHGEDAFDPQAPEALEAPEALDEHERHISGQELCDGLRRYALEHYGLMARTVLRRWSIRRSDDFGYIVFAMVEAGLMRKTDEDSLADFQNVFDFSQAFNPDLELTELTELAENS